MNIMLRRSAVGLATLDCLATLLGMTALWALTVIVAAGQAAPRPGLYLSAFAVAEGGYLLHHARCMARPPRVRSLPGFLWAPFGRIRRIRPGTPLLAGKRYYYYPSAAGSPMLVWMGWWNCRSFTGAPASTEYVFFDRRTRYAIPVVEILADG